MKTLAALLLSVTAAAHADWQQIASTDEGVTFIDPTRIYDNAPYVRAWTLANRVKKDEYGAMSYVTFTDYDCKAREMRIVQAITYAKPFGKGKVLRNMKRPHPGWLTVPPDSMGEATFNAICQAKPVSQ